MRHSTDLWTGPQEYGDGDWRKPRRGSNRRRRANAERRASFLSALGLTLASALVWGIAHMRSGRRMIGSVLLTLSMGILGTVIAVAIPYSQNALTRESLAQYAVRPDVLATIGAGGPTDCPVLPACRAG
jgi:hypothetical protein